MKEIKPEFRRLNPKDRLFELSVPLIGLTGSIATGKSSASKFFNNIGCPIICADTLVKTIYSLTSSVSFIKRSYKLDACESPPMIIKDFFFISIYLLL